MHAGAVQRMSSVYLPGRTKAQTSSRASPLGMQRRQRRHRARPVGAALMRYVLFLCLKPLLLTGAGCGGAVGEGAGTNTGVGTFFLRWRFAGSSHTSGSQINMEP